MDERLKKILIGRDGGGFNKKSCKVEFIKYFIRQLFFRMTALTFVGQNPITFLLLDPVESNKYFPVCLNRRFV